VLIRIVRMTFRPSKLDTFLDHFDTVSPKIRGFDGCEHLELWQDARFPNVCTTHSHWKGDDALEHYRHSNLFRTTWAQVKPWFAAAPTAHSYSVGRSAEAIQQRVAAAPSE
jgi:quinol monooxygenase YgiN